VTLYLCNGFLTHPPSLRYVQLTVGRRGRSGFGSAFLFLFKPDLRFPNGFDRFGGRHFFLRRWITVNRLAVLLLVIFPTANLLCGYLVIGDVEGRAFHALNFVFWSNKYQTVFAECGDYRYFVFCTSIRKTPLIGILPTTHLLKRSWLLSEWLMDQGSCGAVRNKEVMERGRVALPPMVALFVG
jgi:hypothetical protein